MSTLYRRPGSPYVWIAFTDQWGRRVRKSTGVKFEIRGTRWIIPRLAYDVQRKTERDVVSGVWDLKPRGRSPALSEVLNSYLSSAGSNLKPNSRRSKTHAVKRLSEFLGGDVPVASVTKDDLFEWKAALLEEDISEHTVANWIREVSPLFRWAHEEGLIDRSPMARGLKLNPPVKPPAIYSDDEFDRVLSAARPHLRNALSFLWGTGFRLGEMISLRWSRSAATSGYLDFQANVIHVWNQKEGRYDVHPMKGVRGLLEELPRRGEYVFPSSTGPKLDQSRFSHEVKAIVRKLGLREELTVHSIRKSYCSRLIRQGVDFGTVQKLMRHKDPATTMRYYAQFSLETLEDGQGKVSTSGTQKAHSEENRAV